MKHSSKLVFSALLSILFLACISVQPIHASLFQHGGSHGYGGADYDGESGDGKEPVEKDPMPTSPPITPPSGGAGTGPLWVFGQGGPSDPPDLSFGPLFGDDAQPSSIPEPMTLALLGLGLAGAVIRKRRRAINDK